MLQGLARLPNGLSVRPARPSDKQFLRKLVDDKYSDLKTTTDLPRDQLEHLMEIQLQGQTQGYGAMFPNAVYFVIEKTGERIGKLSLDWDGEAARVVDLGFIAKAQGKGYGQTVVLALLQACGQSKCPLTVVCLAHNVALLHFLQSHGFEAEPPEAGAAHILLTWTPTADAMRQ
ncbi:MAG: GNAT family N-acetyltransferase [Marivibrio sp.]|uniref:GNAT family N-acetyltransferase n=1 Tax=Marivibrio sp. TaxID=2039719 RepID=UPI0032EF39C9